VRTFVAVELDDGCRQALLRAVAALEGAAKGVRWVRAEALHITIKFIGELDPRDLGRTIECLRVAACSSDPFTMDIAGLGAFPSRSRPRVIHVGVGEGAAELTRLQEAVDGKLADELGLPAEGRRYVPHVTLGRVRKRRGCLELDGLKTLLPTQEFGSVRVDSFVLMESKLQPSGAIYSKLHTFPLQQRPGGGPGERRTAP
jgi:2'-5' RNA ligase